MRLTTAIIFSFFASSVGANADVLHIGDACSYFGETMPSSVSTFGSINEAATALDKIMEVQGLERNFEIEAASVPNAAAVIQGSERLILYNPNFMDDMRKAAGTEWAPISILAHEVGHHLQGHTLTMGGSRPPIELEADKFSGFVLQRLGASLEEAMAAMKTFGPNSASDTHPGKSERLAAINAGWKKACDLSPACSGATVTKPDPVPAPQPQIAWTDQCQINGEPVRISSNGRVVSAISNQVVGQKAPSLWPLNCAFDLLRGDGARYCVQQSGLVFSGTPVPVGQCSPIN